MSDPYDEMVDVYVDGKLVFRMSRALYEEYRKDGEATREIIRQDLERAARELGLL